MDQNYDGLAHHWDNLAADLASCDHAGMHADALGARLEAKLLERVATEWRSINYVYFRSALRLPVIELVDDEGAVARWSFPLRRLALGRGPIARDPWPSVREALEREVVQQFVEERLGVFEGLRGPTYRTVCRRLGIRAVPAPADASADTPGSNEARVFARVRKLLALASSPNRHEAENAAMAAQRLMLKFNIEAARVDEDSAEGYGHRHLGPPLGRPREHHQRLAKILSDHFFVESVWVPIYLPRRGETATVLEVCGLEVNLRMAEHVHAFASQTAARLWAAYAEGHPQATTRDRLAFLAGVMRGLEDKLAEQRATLEQRGLVWVPGPGLGAYFRQRNPRVHYARQAEGQRSGAYEAGARVGRRITLAPPVAQTRRRGPPRALGPA